MEPLPDFGAFDFWSLAFLALVQRRHGKTACVCLLLVRPKFMYVHLPIGSPGDLRCFTGSIDSTKASFSLAQADVPAGMLYLDLESPNVLNEE